jgi:molybdenum cofactor cytidylyltransferase
VVLAAGSSSRLGRPKQEIVFEGETLLVRAVRLARETCEEVIVVDNFLNPNAAEGIASSIRAGVAEAPEDARILILLCDQPRITTDHLRALIDTDAPIAATGYSGIAGVPAIFAPRFREELLALEGDRGARVVIERHRDQTTVLKFPAAAIDIDTPDDLQKL